MAPTQLPQFDFLPLVRDIALLTAFAVGSFYFLKHKIGSRGLLMLSATAGVTLLMYAAGVSLAQYFVWSKDSFTQILLNAPLASEVPASPALRFVIESIGAHEYFLYYAWGHFLLPAFLVIVTALLWYMALRAVKYVSPQSLKPGEPELALLATLVAPWPTALLVVPSALTILLAILIDARLTPFSPPTVLTNSEGVPERELSQTHRWQSFTIPLLISGGFFVTLRVTSSLLSFF